MTVRHKIQPERFSNLQQLINEHFASTGFPEWVLYITVPRHLAKEKIAYQFNAGPKTADKLLDDMWGDCEDNTVLICSMYEALNLKTATVTVHNDNGQSHILPLVSHPNYPIKKVCDYLTFYYHQVHEFDNPPIAVEETVSGAMVVVGSTMTEYVGDIQSLINQGYAYRSSNSWQWTNKTNFELINT